MLNDLKTMLGIDAIDTSQDSKLRLILSTATAQLKNLLGGIDPPESVQHIIREVAIIRFNRIGSEGMTSHSVEGETITFSTNDFDGFSDEIQAFLNMQKDNTRGKVRFI